MRKYKLEDFEADKNDYNWYIYDNEMQNDNYKSISINLLSVNRVLPIPDEIKRTIEELANKLISENHFLSISDVVIVARLWTIVQQNKETTLEFDIKLVKIVQEITDDANDYMKTKVIIMDNELYKVCKQYIKEELEQLLFG